MTAEGKGLYAGIAAFTAAVFFVQIFMPLGFTPWLLFVIPLGLTYWAPYLYAPILVAAVCTILVFVGYFLSPSGVPTPIAVTNRAFGTVTFWVLGLLILQYKILANRLSQLTKTLSTEAHRTHPGPWRRCECPARRNRAAHEGRTESIRSSNRVGTASHKGPNRRRKTPSADDCPLWTRRCRTRRRRRIGRDQKRISGVGPSPRAVTTSIIRGYARRRVSRTWSNTCVVLNKS